MFNTKLNILAVAALAIGLAACTKDPVAPKDSDRINVDQVFNQKGEAYMMVNLSQPTTMSTRADDFTYDDGDEFAIDETKSYLILFSGTKESDAVARSVYKLDQLTDMNTVGGPTGQITSNKSFVQAITKFGIESGQKVYAYVILNAPDQFDFAEDGDDLSKNVLTVTLPGDAEARNIVNNSAENTSGNMTFAALMALKYTYSTETAQPLTATSTAFITGGTKFMMTNATLTTKNGGTKGDSARETGETPFTLSEIDVTKMYKTAEEAQKGTAAAVIRVERAMAKVSLKQSATKLTNLGVDDANGELTFEVKGWALLNANKSSFLTKNINPASGLDYTQAGTEAGAQGYFASYANYYSRKETQSSRFYRFVDANNANEGLESHDGSHTAYRIHWAIDPNYDATDNASGSLAANAESANAALFSATPTDFAALNTPLYPFENTTDVDNMTLRNTTGVLIKVQVTAADASTKTEITENGFLTTSDAQGKVLTVKQLNNIAVLNKLANDTNLKILADAVAKDGSAYAYPADPTNAALTTWRSAWNTLFAELVTVPTVEQLYANTTLFGASFDQSKTFSQVYTASGKLVTVNESAFAENVTIDNFKTDDKITTAPTGFVNVTTEAPYSFDGAANNAINDAVAIVKAYLTNTVGFLYSERNPATFGFYKEGIMYYKSLIRHFTDATAPWNLGESPAPTAAIVYPHETVANATYETQGNNYLGRYGIVRNNWYQLSLSRVSGLGAIAGSGFTTNTPDDSMTMNIRLDISTLPWAIHTQNLEF